MKNYLTIKTLTFDLRSLLFFLVLLGFSQSFAQVNSVGAGDDGSKSCDLCDLSANQINAQSLKNCGYGFSLDSGLDAPCVRDHYVWDFGDGNQSSSTSSFAYHRFDQNGTYNVCATVWAELNGAWCSSTLCISLTVTGCENPCSDCDIIVDPPTVTDISDCEKGFNVNVDLNGSNCTQQGLVWDFGDGTVLNTTQTNPIHQYTVPGVYTVCVTQKMTTVFGQPCETTSCTTVDVTDCNDQYDCSDCGTSINPIQIWNLSNCRRGFNAGSGMNGTNCTRVDQVWDFGDGNMITTTNAFVSNQYAMDGTYDVCFTVNASHNVTGEICSTTRCTTIVISGCGINTENDLSGTRQSQPNANGDFVSVSPNPIAAGKTLNINIDQAIQGLQLLDLTGRIILTQEVDGFGDQQIQIPSELSEGIYFVRSTHGEFNPVRVLVRNQ